MNALHIILVLGKSTGGIGTHVVDLAAGLRAAGHHVTVVTDPLTATTFGIDDAVLAWPDPRRPDPRSLRRLRAILRDGDIVHAHGHQAGALVAALLPRLGRGGFRAFRGARTSGRAHRRANRAAVVLSLHNESPPMTGLRSRLAERVERAAITAADLVTGASSDLVDRARALGARRAELARVPSPRVPALLSATDADRQAARDAVRTAYGIGEQEPLIVTISRIAPQKDLGTLVAAAQLLDTRPAWLVAGAGILELQHDLELRARETGVRFVGPVADPSALLLAADVFALTSTWEARALVVQEALAAGVPVVASAVGGLPDLLDGLGVLIPPRDPQALARALESLLKDPEAGRTAGDRGRERAAAWPTSPQMVAQWVVDYSGLIEAVG
ncbi:MAG: glycosyltransferase family 4 protein [Dermatophilaceae bacterium]